MIIFKNIDITSFKSIFHVNLDFTTIQGKFYALEGKNNTVDFAMSNGSGKSTLFDALSYALYGTTMGIYLKKEDYQNKFTKIPLNIKVNFNITSGNNKGNYEVVRTLNSTTLFKNNEDITELTKTETEKKLYDVLNLTKEEFFSFTYLTQTAGGNFLGKTASEKLAVIKDFIFGEELLDIKNKIDNLLKEYKNIKNNLAKELSNKQGKLSGLESIERISIDEIENLNVFNHNENIKNLKNLKQQQQQIQQNLKQISILKANYSNLVNQMQTIKNDMKSIKEKICPTCHQNLINTEELEQSLRNKAKNIKLQALEIKTEIQNLNNESDKTDIYEIENKIQILTKEINNYEYKLKQSKQQQGIGLEIKTLKDEIKDLENQELTYNNLIEQVTNLQKYFNTVFIQYVQKSFLTEIENYLNLYCYEVFNAKFSLKFNNNSLELFIGEHPYSYFSGGERQRIDFLFVFAIKVALSNFTDKCTNLLIFDESLSGSDSVAFDNSVDLISRLSESSDLTTILISHRENSNISSNKIVLERFNDNTKLQILN